MNSEMFEHCIDNLASALHADLLAARNASTENFLNIAVQVINHYREEPIGLDELEVLDEAIRDAARRIQFGFSQPNTNPIRRHIYIRDQLTYAFSATEERKGLFGEAFLKGLYTIAEEE